MWVVAAIGIAVGAGAWFLAGTATLIVWVALRLLHRIEDRLMPDAGEEAVLRIRASDPGLLSAIEKTLSDHGIPTASVQVVRIADGIEATYRMHAAGESTHGLISDLMKHDGVRETAID
jgi:putative Mg2+ transporter-C (MgtC) family protein